MSIHDGRFDAVIRQIARSAHGFLFDLGVHYMSFLQLLRDIFKRVNIISEYVETELSEKTPAEPKEERGNVR